MKTKRKGFNMFQKRRKKKKQSTLLYVDATNKSYERAISEFKRKVKNAGIMEDLKKREFFQTRREGRRLSLQKTIRRQKRINESLKGLGFTKRGRI